MPNNVASDQGLQCLVTGFSIKKRTSKFSEFISPAEVALASLKFILSFIKFCPLVTKLWLICGF